MNLRTTFAVLGACLLLPAVPAAAAGAGTPPTNDDLADATVVTALPFADQVDVALATREPGEPAASGPDCWGEPERTVWYAFTPESDVRVAADTFGSSFDTLLAVFARSDGDHVQVACNDDAAGSAQARVHLDLTAGTTYVFQAGSHEWQETSDLRFRLEESDLPLLDASVAVTPTARVTPRNGGATVEGTITCTRPATVAVDLGIVQQGTVAYGWDDEVACDPGEVVPWQAPTMFVDGRLRRGNAELFVNVYVQDGLDHVVVSMETTLSLLPPGGPLR